MSRVIATGSYLPEKVVTNQRLIEQTGIDSSDEWVKQRTGIEERHFAATEESVSDLAIAAVENLLEQVDEQILQDIQLIIVASMSSRLPTPSVANQVQRALGIEQAWAFDISGACSGFVMAIEMAEKLSRDHTSGYTLVIGTEKMSDILNFEDRGTSILFGDGAGAILIEQDGEGLTDYQSQFISVPDEEDSIAVPEDGLMTMDGRSVFNFVLRQVIPSLSAFIQKEVGTFDFLISHQANARFLDIFAKKLNVSREQIPANIASVANTSAASIPILLDQLTEEGKITLDGSQKVIFLGYGGGLSWGQISLRL